MSERVERNKFIEPARFDYSGIVGVRDQVVVVVGAGRGFGETASRLLKHLGAHVVCVDADEARGKKVSDDLDSPLVVVDVTQQNGVDELARFVEKRYGRLDSLIDIVGMGRAYSWDDYTLEDWDWDLRVNVTHAFLLGKALGPIIGRDGGGAMVFISAVIASYANQTTPGYPPSKAALQSWVKQFAERFGPLNVRVNAIAPGPFMTEKIMTEHWKGDDDPLVESMSGHTLLNRMGHAYEIAWPAVFLCTPGAGYITGQTINIEGGTMSRNPVGIDARQAERMSEVAPVYARGARPS
jgi:NAD(P)-dependent dehydrogenase (short-subunit alcohol dehydrogenase family)